MIELSQVLCWESERVKNQESRMQHRKGKLKPKEREVESKESRKERRKWKRITRSRIEHLPYHQMLMKTKDFISSPLFLQRHRYQDIFILYQQKTLFYCIIEDNLLLIVISLKIKKIEVNCPKVTKLPY